MAKQNPKSINAYRIITAILAIIIILAMVLSAIRF